MAEKLKIGACGAKFHENGPFCRRFPFINRISWGPNCQFFSACGRPKIYVTFWDLSAPQARKFWKLSTFIGHFPFRNRILESSKCQNFPAGGGLHQKRQILRSPISQISGSQNKGGSLKEGGSLSFNCSDWDVVKQYRIVGFKDTVGFKDN